MKRVRIKKGKVGVITKNDNFVKVLEAGSYFIGLTKKVELYNTSMLYPSNMKLKLMLEDEKAKNMIELVEINDNEIAIMYEENNFKNILTSGQYFYWKGVMDLSFTKIDLSKVDISENIDPSIYQKIALRNYIRVYSVEPNEIGLLFINNKFVKKLNEGMYYFWKNAIPVDVQKVDIRQLQIEVSGQEMLTKDKAALRVNFTAQYKITDIENALLKVENCEKQLYILIQLALREFIGTLTLDELLSNKELVSEYILKRLKDKTKDLGIKLIYAGIRDVILPGEVKDIMNQVLIAQKQAQAGVIARREETASTRSLLNTANLMKDNEMLFKLKEMEYLEKIADKVGEITVSGGGQVLEQLKSIFSK